MFLKSASGKPIARWVEAESDATVGTERLPSSRNLESVSTIEWIVNLPSEAELEDRTERVQLQQGERVSYWSEIERTSRKASNKESDRSSAAN
ncbi:MAG: hypothetical protein AAFX40_10455 [Cyanobacteria bacterium J06639_1]